MDELPSILWLSVRIATAATLLAALIALPLAHRASRGRLPGKSVVEGLILLPLVLPPTVVGFLIILIGGRQGWIGQHLYAWFGYSLLFRFESAVIAAAVVALPLLYLPARSAFASVERDQEDNARLMGASRWQVLWHITLPLARRGIASGLLLAFARAIGEFGATMMVFGWQPGRLTLPVSIYAAYEEGQLASSSGAVCVLIALSLGMVMVYNRTGVGRQD